MEPETHIQWGEPVIKCKGPDRKWGGNCQWWIELPFAGIPKSEHAIDADDSTLDKKYKHLSGWPPDDWRAAIGCPGCGEIRPYEARDVEWAPTDREEPDTYRANTLCYSVSCRCAKESCPFPVRFHIVVDEEDQDVSEAALLDRLRADYYSGAKCSEGHPRLLSLVPRDRYQLEIIREAIPKDW